MGKKMRYLTHVSTVENQHDSAKSKALMHNFDTMALEYENGCVSAVGCRAVDMVLVVFLG